MFPKKKKKYIVDSRISIDIFNKQRFIKYFYRYIYIYISCQSNTSMFK